MKEQEFLHLIRLDRATLTVWIEEAWLSPGERDGERVFEEVDLARARLILDLKQDLGVNDQGVGVILHLVDQVHGLRSAMRELLGSMHEKSAAERER
jgi:chaperone modulatory protein CbpM